MERIALPPNLGALLDARAEELPDERAWYFFERAEDFTYAALRDYANRAANALRCIGIRHGTHVAVMSSNRIAFGGCWLGLAKLGAVLVPINTRYTAPEMHYVLADADCEYLIIAREYRERFAAIEAPLPRLSAGRIVVIDGEAGDEPSWESLVSHASEAFEPEWPVALDDVLNIQYTSGTTGFPKGCLLTHRFWMLSAKVVADDLHFALKRVIYNQNLFYMDGPFLATLCFFAGAAFFLATRPSASRFVEWIRRYRIQYCFFFEALYKVPETALDADNSLELIQTFGFNKAHHADLERRFAAPAREAFGMTECGAALSLPVEATHMVGSGSCGLPVRHREVTIMDEQGHPVAAGEVGELWLRGEGLMLGYYKKPEATAEVMRPDGWFRTGDLFRRDTNGYFYIVGRKKDMVRRNAENIACREVEEVLRGLAEVKEAAVVAVPDERVGEEVKAYIQLQEGLAPESVPPEAILAHCEGRLAVFKIPRYIEYRESFPLTDSARVEKTKLVAESEDLRLRSYDRVDRIWR